MKAVPLSSASFLACVAGALAIAALAQAPSPARAATPEWEYRIVDDVEQQRLSELASEGWEYAGYLGIGIKGVGNDQTLWRRSVK